MLSMSGTNCYTKRKFKHFISFINGKETYNMVSSKISTICHDLLFRSSPSHVNSLCMWSGNRNDIRH